MAFSSQINFAAFILTEKGVTHSEGRDQEARPFLREQISLFPILQLVGLVISGKRAPVFNRSVSEPGPHQSPIRFKAMGDFQKENSSRPWQSVSPQKTVGTTPRPRVLDLQIHWLSPLGVQPFNGSRRGRTIESQHHRVVYLRDGTAANQIPWF